MSPKNEKMKEDRLKAVLSEYEALTSQKMQTIKFQLQVLTIMPSAISLVLSLIVIYQFYDAILLIPFITITLTYRWIWDVQTVVTYSRYLREIEKKKIPKLIGFFEEKRTEGDHLKYWIGWEHYWKETVAQRTSSWAYPVIGFLGIPTILCILYFFIYGFATKHFIYLSAAVVYGIFIYHIVITIMRRFPHARQRIMDVLSRVLA